MSRLSTPFDFNQYTLHAIKYTKVEKDGIDHGNHLANMLAPMNYTDITINLFVLNEFSSEFQKGYQKLTDGAVLHKEIEAYLSDAAEIYGATEHNLPDGSAAKTQHKKRTLMGKTFEETLFIFRDEKTILKEHKYEYWNTRPPYPTTEQYYYASNENYPHRIERDRHGNIVAATAAYDEIDSLYYLSDEEITALNILQDLGKDLTLPRVDASNCRFLTEDEAFKQDFAIQMKLSKLR